MNQLKRNSLVSSSKRHFLPPLSLQQFHELPSLDGRKKEFYMATAIALAEKCWERSYNYPSENDAVYAGTLGRLCFLRLRLACHFIALAAAAANTISQETYRRRGNNLLAEGLKETQKIIDKLHSSGSKMSRRCTLLEGPLVGSLALKTVFLHFLGRTSSSVLEQVNDSANELLSIGRNIDRLLDEDECEVLYGRCGYLHAILFIRKHLSQPNYGQDTAVSILDQILTNAIKTSEGTDWPLLWTWHKVYLGACHGLSGILYTFLHFLAELEILSEIRGVNVVGMVKSTIDKLNDTQVFASTGNLASSLGSKRDELVQWCHGAPGHVVLLLRAYAVFKEEKYLELAKVAGRNTIFTRGILTKGVGLCHGISGNAFAFLSIYRCLQENSMQESESWLKMSCFFADLGIEKLSELETKPDRPHSLLEGIGGLVCLLIDLQSPEDRSCGFPCYEV